MELQQVNGGNITVNEAVFGAEFNESLVHQVVTAYMAAGRAGTKAQKNRSAVSGGGRKPWKQKGTGRARAGTIRSPLWRSGGVTFAAQPRSYAQKINKKMYRAAMRSIFAELVRQERLLVVESFDLAEPKTKGMVAKLAEVGADNALIVTAEVNENLWLASRNLYKIEVADVAAVDPVSLVGHDKVVITADALKQIEDRLAA